MQLLKHILFISLYSYLEFNTFLNLILIHIIIKISKLGTLNNSDYISIILNLINLTDNLVKLQFNILITKIGNTFLGKKILDFYYFLDNNYAKVKKIIFTRFLSFINIEKSTNVSKLKNKEEIDKFLESLE